jgi:hypothetical protein
MRKNFGKYCSVQNRVHPDHHSDREQSLNGMTHPKLFPDAGLQPDKNPDLRVSDCSTLSPPLQNPKLSVGARYSTIQLIQHNRHATSQQHYLSAMRQCTGRQMNGGKRTSNDSKKNRQTPMRQDTNVV